MRNIMGRVSGILRDAVLPYQFGFVQGHSHLDQASLEALRHTLDAQNADDNKRITSAYEVSFAKLIGDGAGVSFASGRMAFYALMKVLGIGAGDEVILPAFTCAVMPNAVMRTGASPVYADIDRTTFGSEAQAIERVISKRTKLIVAQHSFGIPCNIDKIAALAKNAGIPLVEDCAITLDASLKGTTVGNWGDAAIFSTDHTKPLNTLIGGFLYTKSSDLLDKITAYSAGLPSLLQEHQNLLYQQLLFERHYNVPMRYPQSKLINLFRAVLGRVRGNRKAAFLTGDYGVPESGPSPYPYPASLPPFLAQLGLIEIERWADEKARRKKLLIWLLNAFEQSRYRHCLTAIYRDCDRDIVPLRFIITCPDAKPLLERLAQFVDIERRWFQQPIICAAGSLESLGYVHNTCRESEEICATIINLPCVMGNEDFRLLERSLCDLLEIGSGG